jgi:hypothetical protein
MADRTSASLFGMFFKVLAENPTDENKAIAERLARDYMRDYDFSPYQMYADDALRTLGLNYLVESEEE